MGVPRMVADPDNGPLLAKSVQIVICQSSYQSRRALAMSGLCPSIRLDLRDIPAPPFLHSLVSMSAYT